MDIYHQQVHYVYLMRSLVRTLRTGRPSFRRYFFIGVLFGTFIGGTTGLAAIGDTSPLARPVLSGLIGGTILGCGSVAVGVAQFRSAYRTQRATCPETVTPGRVVVTGSATAVAEPLRTPLGDHIGLCYVADVDQQTNRGLWDPRYQETDGVQFQVGDSGPIVDPQTSTLSLDHQTDREWQLMIDGHESPPEDIEAWLRAEQRTTGHRKRRYREWWVAPGDQVTVTGTVQQHNGRFEFDQSARTVITHGTATDNAGVNRRNGQRFVAVGGILTIGTYLPLVILAFGW